MKQIMLTGCLFLISGYLYAESIPAGLVKATTENDPKCVEYYKFHDEMYCSTKPLSSQKVDPKIKEYETQFITFDDRIWQPVWGQKADEIWQVEYVPMGDNIDDWKELVTSQFFPTVPVEVTPKEFANQVISQIKDAGYDPKITFHRITAEYVIFEFQIASPKNQIQDELQKITKGNDGLYALHYAIKEFDMGKQRRATWLEKLEKSEIK